MKIEMFEMKSSEWQKLNELEMLNRDWSKYHFINLFNDDCISLKGIGIYIKSEPTELKKGLAFATTNSLPFERRVTEIEKSHLKEIKRRQNLWVDSRK